MTDVLGVLEAYDDGGLTVRPEQGEPVTIARDLVVTGKPVPSRASTRLRISAEQLEAVCERGWRAPVEQPLGDWTLRAAGGFTGRANSARVGGHPGATREQAVAAVIAFYVAHRLPPMVQVVVGSDWQVFFEKLGWVQARPGGQDALVEVASVAQARRRRSTRERSPSPDLVEIRNHVDESWMSLYGRSTGIDPAIVRAVMESGDAVAFARIGDPVVGIGRAVLTGDWMGLQAVEVAPERRRQGLASLIVDALLEWGASQGALSAYLQNVGDNTAALDLYAGYAFAPHHSYRYLSPTPPG